jgi:putative CGCGG family rSAM target protein
MSAPAHDEVAPVTDRVHDNSWSANLEGPEHAADRDAMLREARRAVTHTAPGNHVNLVTHGEHAHPEGYLFEVPEEAFGDAVEYEHVEQCGCGGHVTRVRVHETLASE